MKDLRQVAQHALKVMDDHMYRADTHEFYEAKEALRAALAEPEQEPDGIGWLKRDSGYFTAPTPRKPVELTDWDIDRVTDQQWAQHNDKPIYAAHRAYARAVIAAYEAIRSRT